MKNMEKRIYTNNVFKVFVSVFVVISLIVSLYALIVGNQPVVYAENSADDTFSIENEVKCFTDSDYLYDAENQVINTAYTIQQYKTNLAGKKIGKDDYIVQIIPKSYFYTVGNVTKIGKEYGFFIKTEICLTGYFSRVLVF